MLRAFGDTMKATLTDGRVVELQPEDFNPVGQIYVAKLVERGTARGSTVRHAIWDGASRCHDCRHTFISFCVMSGIDYMTIARWVGHKDGGVLIGKVYGHLADGHAAAAGERVSFEPAIVNRVEVA